ncbi:MAG: transposase [Pirellulales bacterium]
MKNFVPSFAALLQELNLIMTLPTFQNFLVIAYGWVFARRRTVTAMIQAAGAVGVKHHSTFHRFFAAARWSLDELGLTTFGLVQPWLGETTYLALDDTLARKSGRRMFGAGMHHDPLISSRKLAVLNWGHSWVIVGVLVKFPFRTDRYFCLPILFRLYLNKSAADRARRVYRTRPELAVEMLQVLAKAKKTLRFHVVADSLYGGKSVLRELPANCQLTSRLHLDARLYDAPPARRPGQRGRARKRGERLSSPRRMLEDRAHRVTLELYGRRERVRLSHCVARSEADLARPLRVVAVESLTTEGRLQAFYSTCPEATAQQVLAWYARRWAIEQTFQETKGYLGFEQPQSWTRRAVERTAPLAMLLYSLIVLWFADHGHRLWQAPERPWYRSKRGPAFVDMLDILRTETLRSNIISLGLQGPGSRKIIQTLQQVSSLAA